ncbi:hypothetical protein FQA39_LY18044 [Lamprigera yunnana]|nr:hypothetical protein FQA39_LY18044 [Lamprigera yunnana]
MPVNFVECMKILNKPNVHIKNKENVNRLLHNIIVDGKEKLQIITDFDKTLTKQHEVGKLFTSSFGVFARCPSVSSKYVKCVKELMNKYQPIEIDPKIAHAEKNECMVTWWNHIDTNIRGETVSYEEIEQTAIAEGPSLRDGSEDFFLDLKKANIPVLVFSAGLGDSVTAILRHSNIMHSNVKVVSNFLKYDENGVICGFRNSPLIHVLNKNEHALKADDYMKCIKGRDNVILMGDALGDCSMADGVYHAKNVLKIGFLYELISESLPFYMDAYDIVLEDDQTMNVPYEILKTVLETSAEL